MCRIREPRNRFYNLVPRKGTAPFLGSFFDMRQSRLVYAFVIICHHNLLNFRCSISSSYIVFSVSINLSTVPDYTQSYSLQLGNIQGIPFSTSNDHTRDTMAYKAEDIDLDSFLNLDSHFASPNLANLNKEKGIIAPLFQQPPIEKINTYAPFQTSQIFSGPSHQYDQHKQHIPLPPGALANSLAAARKANFQFTNVPQYGMASDNTLFDMGEDWVDFSSTNSHRPSYAGTNDMDMDFDSPVDGLYTSDFVDPNAIGGHEEDSPVPARAEIVRVYPGMHSHQAQQAALAKQQQQMEIQRQQQQQVKAHQPQQQPIHKSSASKGVNKVPADPVVEERISRLLNQMRQEVKTPSSQSEDQSPSSSMTKSKKEEEEMDEDERLLASEEGKKLSSKERRQLRNKVSARAFRSRRKGKKVTFCHG